MFRAWCDAEGREVLLTTRRILSYEIGAATSTIRYACWCGHHGQVTDRRLVVRDEPAAADPTPAPAVTPAA